MDIGQHRKKERIGSTVEESGIQRAGNGIEEEGIKKIIFSMLNLC